MVRAAGRIVHPVLFFTAVPHFIFAACTDFCAVRSQYTSGDAALCLFWRGRRICSMSGIYFALAYVIRRCASQPPVEVGRRGKGCPGPSLPAQRLACSNPREESVSCSTFVRSLPV